MDCVGHYGVNQLPVITPCDNVLQTAPQSVQLITAC